jgi:hypothetical protein
MAKDSAVTTQATDDRLQLLKARLAVAKAWSKKPHEAMKRYLKEYEIEDVSDTEEIRDKVRIGFIFRHTESDMPAIFDDQPDLFFKGKNPKTRLFEPLFDSAYDWLWDFERLEEVIEDTALYFLVIGMGFVKSPWVTKNKTVTEMQEVPVMDMAGMQAGTQQQEVTYNVPIVDNPQGEVQDPFKIFFSPETKFKMVMTSRNCPYYFTEETVSPEEIKSLYGIEVDSDESLKLDDVEIDSKVEALQAYKDDMKRVTKYEYYGTLPEEQAKGITDEQGNAVKWSYDTEYHLIFTKNKELQAEECPYHSYPLRVIGNYGMANKFWKFGDAKHLLPLVRELEQYRTQILRHTRKMANPKLLRPNDAEVDEKQLTNPNPGIIVNYQPGPNGSKPEYLSPANLGSEVGTGVEMARTDLEQTSGQFSLSQGGGVSQVKTPRGIQTFSEAADKNVRRKRKKIARLIRELIIFQFKQLSVYWKPEDQRTLDVIDEGNAQELPITQEVLQILGDDNILAKIDIEIESLSVNKAQMKQDSLDLLDLALKSEAEKPGYVKLDEIWKDVLQNGFGKKDGDRYLVTEAERQQLAQAAQQPQEPSVNVSIKADAATPTGAALLENEGLMQPGQGQQAAAQTQVQDLQKQQINAAMNPPTPPQQKGGQGV